MSNVENTRPLDRRLQTKRRAQPGDLLIDSLCALCVLIPALVFYGAIGAGILYLVKEVML